LVKEKIVILIEVNYINGMPFSLTSWGVMSSPCDVHYLRWSVDINVYFSHVLYSRRTTFS